MQKYKLIIFIVLFCTVTISTYLYIHMTKEVDVYEINVSNNAIGETIQVTTYKKSEQYTKYVSILVYHHILKVDENKLYKGNKSVISTNEFETQMKYLYENGFHTIDLETLEDFINGKVRIPDKNIVITFDDGYKSNYIYAYPILKKYGLKATIFMITDKITTPPQQFNADDLNYFSWEEIKKSKDVFNFQSHTHGMHYLIDKKGYLLTKSAETIDEDLRYSKELLGSYYFSYPYGQYNSQIINILKQRGYKLAFTVKRGYVSSGDNPYLLNRYSIYPNMTMKEFKKIVNIIP